MGKHKLRNMLLAAVVAASTVLGGILPVPGTMPETVQAAVNYPKQAVNFTAYTTDKNLAESGSSIIGLSASGTAAENWEIVYISDGLYNIVSMNDGKYLTAGSDGSVSAAGYSGNSPQQWKISGAKKDYDGYYLYYTITNVYTGKALTYYQASGNVGVASYTGDGAQLWKLNLYGQQGFSANCKTSSGEKAATIGGILGKTVYASNASTLIDYMNSTSPLTIVVSGTIDMKNYSNTRIRDNKTIVGAYSGAVIKDCQLRTNDAYGATNDSPSDNIVFRNIDFRAASIEDRILVNIWSSRQIWIDHCSFTSTLNRAKDEVGKFIWINTPYDNYRDAKDIGRSPDYITISYCTFKNRYWTVAYGTQNSETTRCRTTLMYNLWDQNVRRCPQIGNGTGHIYNNYFVGSDSGIPDGCAQIIGGDGSTMVSENCRFQSVYGYEIFGDSNYRDSNSYTAKKSSSTPTALNHSPKYSSTSWKPSGNYGYSLLAGYLSNGIDTKRFCSTYAGAKTSASNFKYVTDSDMSGWVVSKYASPFVSNSFSSAYSSTGSSSSNSSVNTSSYATFTEGAAFMIKNANSGLYMDVAGGSASNNANVQQWGASESAAYNTWRLFSAGNGYYYIVSAVGDTATYVLDVEGKKNTNGANIDIYQYNGGTNQQFKFVPNSDGSYKILSRVSGDSKGVEIVNAEIGSGANVQQWEINGHACQNWILESVVDPGVAMSTDNVYTFQNANSGLLLEIAGGSMADGTNVQQWGDGGYNTQKWILKSFGSGNYYYIRSQQNATYVLRAESGSNGGNIDIRPYSTKDSAMLFKFCKNLDGTYTIKTRASKESCVVEVKDASTSSGANVQQWEKNGHACQNWMVNTTTAATDTSSSTDSGVSAADSTYNGTYYIQSASSGLYLDVYNGLSDNGTNIQQWYYNGYDAQKFQLVGVGNGYYAILTGASGYKSCVDVTNGSAADGTNIAQWEYWGGDMQLFKVVDNGDGTVSFLTKASGDASAMDVYGWSSEAGGNIGQWTYSGYTNQRFILTKA